MIFETLSFLSAEVNKFLNLKLGASLEPRLKMGNASRALDDTLTGQFSLSEKAIISLVNVEEDRVVKQHENFKKTATSTIYKNPPVRLNLFVLFSVNKADYEDSLKWLTVIIQYFQHQNVFTGTSHPDLHENISKLIVELHSLNFEQVNHLWSTLGGKYLPSVMYKVRQITIDEDLPTGESGFIKEIGIESKMKQPVS